ncbi:MAG TPA: hypothetical protein VJ323_00940, partial [Bryobacteraceae bacterium]|nr:hypothetical protein [Bryobacteraceae bacterium]
KRQPHAANLLVSRGPGVDNAARDIQMSLRIAVVEKESLPEKPGRGNRNQDGRQPGNNRYLSPGIANLRRT